MYPHVAFRVELRRLRHAPHRGHFGKKVIEEGAGVQQFKAAARATLSEDAHQFVAHALSGNGADEGVVAADSLEGGGLDLEPEAGGEGNGAQEAEVVFAKTDFRVADGADDTALEIGAAADEIENFAGVRIHHEAIDGEIAAD